MVKSGICDCSMKSSRCRPVSGVSVSRPRMMPETTSRPWSFSVLTASSDRHHHVVILLDRFQRVWIGRLDAAEHRDEVRLAHQREDFRPLGDVQRRLARQADAKAVPLLPFDEMRQQLERRLAVADEIVVDEIDRAGDAALDQLVEFGDHLLRRLQARIASVEARNVAELALIRTAARILDAAEEVALDLGQLIGRNRKLRHLDALFGREDDLPLGARNVARQARDQLIGGVAKFADVKIVERRIVVRTRADRRTAERHRKIEGVRPAADVVHLPTLDVHAADEHRFGPFEVGVGRRPSCSRR